MERDIQDTFARWTADFVQAQQKVWDQWTQPFQGHRASSPGSPEDFGRAWQEVIKKFSKISFSSEGVNTNTFSGIPHFFSNPFLYYLNQLTTLMKDLPQEVKHGENWTTCFTKNYTKIHEEMEKTLLSGQFQDYFVFGTQMAQIFPFVCQSFADKNESPAYHPVFAIMQKTLDRLASIPTLGITREKQETFQHNLRDVLPDLVMYQSALRKFIELMTKVYLNGSKRVGVKMGEFLYQQPHPLYSVNDILKIATNGFEEAYTEIVSSDEYAAVNAQLINASVRLKKRNQVLIDDALSAFDIPHRAEMNATHKTVTALKRKVKMLEEKLEDYEEQMEQKFMSLEKHLMERFASLPNRADSSFAGAKALKNLVQKKS